MTIDYKTKGTCSSRMIIEVEDGKIRSLQVIGGCNGNLKGLSALVTGMDVKEVISRLEGIKCGFKPTSCPDQLATALKETAI
ncbi:MAG TPA: TIGR03905 family TSCPD domain-containing protein [Candidatus Galloscillospira stercoripullorum]|nr:TIGR03905 family TSCPD domain-containing protein [Candidatus Galloscillospira stercoripullorum]